MSGFWTELFGAKPPEADPLEIARTLRANDQADPLGSWTGTPAEPGEAPQQDADDLCTTTRPGRPAGGCRV